MSSWTALNQPPADGAQSNPNYQALRLTRPGPVDGWTPAPYVSPYRQLTAELDYDQTTLDNRLSQASRPENSAPLLLSREEQQLARLLEEEILNNNQNEIGRDDQGQLANNAEGTNESTVLLISGGFLPSRLAVLPPHRLSDIAIENSTDVQLAPTALQVSEPKRSYSCTVGSCRKSYAYPMSLHNHIRGIHGRKYDCDVCHRSFNTAGGLVCHREALKNIIHDKASCTCPKCNTKFRALTGHRGLKSHMRECN